MKLASVDRVLKKSYKIIALLLGCALYYFRNKYKRLKYWYFKILRSEFYKLWCLY